MMAKQKPEERSVGRNVKTQIVGDVLTITVDLSKRLKRTGAGNRMLLASSGGSVHVSDDRDVKIGLNVTDALKEGE